jgi:hypothetical protein
MRQLSVVGCPLFVIHTLTIKDEPFSLDIAINN